MNDKAKKTTNTKPEANAPKDEPKNVLREYFESFVVTLIMAFFGMTFIVQAVTVPTGSMQNTINTGDMLLVNKFIFAPGPRLPFLPMREIERGDILVFKYPGDKKYPVRDGNATPYQTNYVKRVIGLPGETIEFKNNQVFINGKLLPEYRVIGDPPSAGTPGVGADTENATLVTREFEQRTPEEKYTVYYRSETMEKALKNIPTREDYTFAAPGKPYKIPNDSYFMMGDNRDNSLDSRFWGVVQRDLIVGRPMFVYWSCDKSYGESFVTCLSHPRFDRIGAMVK
jgi:signal peptidase I